MMIQSTPQNPLRKVAILIASLDDEWSERVLASLPSDQAAVVRQRVEQLTEIDPAEQQEILREFRRSFTDSIVPTNDGVELELSQQNHFERDDYARPTATHHRPLDSLSEADNSFIVDMLVGEHPQTIALVLSRLDTQRAVEVMGKFSPAEQADILQRLAELDTIDQESVQVVESQVARWISEQRERKARISAGMSLVEGIVSKTPPAQRDRMLAEFNKKNSVLALRLARDSVQRESHRADKQSQDRILSRSYVETAPRIASPKTSLPQPAKVEAKSPYASYSAEQCLVELESLDTDALMTALSQSDSQVVRLALVGASEKLLKRALAGLSRREAKHFRQSLREIGPTRISDIVTAQQELLHTASKSRS